MDQEELINVASISKDLSTENLENGALEGADNVKQTPERTGVLSVKPANAWIVEAAKRPDPKVYFHGLIVEGENTVLFAASNVGKSILAVQIADDVARTETVLYVDLELSDKQFQKRYRDSDTGESHLFPPHFMRAELAPELICGIDLEKEILDSIEEAAKHGARFVIVDNLTFICHDAEKSSVAAEFMMKLIRLKKMYGLTTLVIAHTPKRSGSVPITQNDLAGSSKLISFFDAGIALACSARCSTHRYLKQVKVRTGELKYDGDNVMVLNLVKNGGFLRYEMLGVEKEYKLLKQGGPSEDMDEILNILRLQKQGKSQRTIADELGMSPAKVQRRLKKAEDENITLPDNDSENNPDGESAVPSVSPVSPVSEAIQPIQPIHDTDSSA